MKPHSPPPPWATLYIREVILQSRFMRTQDAPLGSFVPPPTCHATDLVYLNVEFPWLGLLRPFKTVQRPLLDKGERHQNISLAARFYEISPVDNKKHIDNSLSPRHGIKDLGCVKATRRFNHS